MKRKNTLLSLALMVWPLAATAQDSVPRTAEVMSIRMKDGSVLLARVVDEEAGGLKIVTLGGVAIDLPRTSIESVKPRENAEASARPSGSNDTRLLFSPTGRPLPRGAGYFSDHFLVFPGAAYGLTDNLSIGAGVSVIPGLGLSEQLFYVSPRIGKQFSDRVAVSGGVLYARGGEGTDNAELGVGFAMATFGGPDKSLTLGLAVPIGREVSRTPVLIVGGTARLSRNLSLVSENWLVLGEGFKLSEQPFALGVRFLGDRLSADVGLILIGDVVKEGFPVPWVSVSYHFGRSR